MRELDLTRTTRPHEPRRVTVVGAGRLGTALTAALAGAGIPVSGPLARGVRIEADAEVVILCVGDAAIPEAAAAVPAGPVLGHCSGATPLAALGDREAFSLHPLLSVTADAPTVFAGAGCAIAGSTPRARAVALELAAALRMQAVEIADEDRVAYHAAASMAANFLVTVEGAAERLAATAGLRRELLVPLVRGAVENWSRLGARRALTGPIVRGDEATVAAQRRVVASRTPELLELFDALASATRQLAETEEARP